MSKVMIELDSTYDVDNIVLFKLATGKRYRLGIVDKVIPKLTDEKYQFVECDRKIKVHYDVWTKDDATGLRDNVREIKDHHDDVVKIEIEEIFIICKIDKDECMYLYEFLHPDKAIRRKRNKEKT